MTMMVRRQMVCIIAPDWPGPSSLSEAVSGALTSLFSDVGVVHFASIALLPAIAPSQGHLPSLVLELVIEEGLRPYDLLYRLVNHPSGASTTQSVGAASEALATASRTGSTRISSR